MPTAQREGELGEADDQHVLRLPDDRIVDVFSMKKVGTTYTLVVSYLSAGMARGQEKEVAELLDSEGRTACYLAIVSVTADSRFESSAPTLPGGGEIVGEETEP